MSSSSSRILSRFLPSFSSLKLSPSSNPCKAISYSSSSTSIPTDYIKRLEIADRKLKTKLQSEAEKFDYACPYGDSGYACPFEVVDIPGDDKLIFKRDFGDEKIVIAAKLEYKRLKCVVTILKGDGSFLTFADMTTFEIEFGENITCKTSDGCFKKPESLRKNIDDLVLEINNLQKIGEHYLKRRGIDYSFTQFACNCLIDRYQEDYVRFLKRVTQLLDS